MLAKQAFVDRHHDHFGRPRGWVPRKPVIEQGLPLRHISLRSAHGPIVDDCIEGGRLGALIPVFVLRIARIENRISGRQHEALPIDDDNKGAFMQCKVLFDSTMVG